MRTIRLLKSWLTHSQGDILQVDNNVAFGLIDSEIATTKLIPDKIIDENKSTKEMGYRKTRKSSYKIK